jgi:hypothetical protein
MNRKRYIKDYQLKPSRDTTCLNPNNFRFNMSIETYNISFEIPEQDLSNAILPASITGLVVETQQIDKGTSNIATPINLVLDCTNVSRKQDTLSRVTRKVEITNFANLFCLFSAGTVS